MHAHRKRDNRKGSVRRLEICKHNKSTAYAATNKINVDNCVNTHASAQLLHSPSTWIIPTPTGKSSEAEQRLSLYDFGTIPRTRSRAANGTNHCTFFCILATEGMFFPRTQKTKRRRPHWNSSQHWYLLTRQKKMLRTFSEGFDACARMSDSGRSLCDKTFISAAGRTEP